jgi:hypothetical protein
MGGRLAWRSWKKGRLCFFEKKVAAQGWRSPPRKASGKASGAFSKKRTKKLLHIQAEPLRKGRSQLSKSFFFCVSKKQAFLLLALPAAADLGSYKKRSKNVCDWAEPGRRG